jgi:dephospho-CoA kinase
VVVVSAPYDIQKTRVLARPGMDMAKFAAIHAKQVPDEEKRRRADFIVDTSQSLEHAHEQVEIIVRTLEGREGKVLSERLKE